MHFGFRAACLSAVFVAGAAAAQDNTVFILQDAPFDATLGNSLFVDQSAASGSRVAGNAAGSAPATQLGGGNTGEVVVSGDQAQVIFQQSNTDSTGQLLGNDADVQVSGFLSQAFLEQSGSANTASLSVNGDEASGLLRQDGNGNDGTLTVVGERATGELVQEGNNNTLAFEVRGADTFGSFTQIGSGLTPVGAQPRVISNGATVTITQTIIGEP